MQSVVSATRKISKESSTSGKLQSERRSNNAEVDTNGNRRIGIPYEPHSARSFSQLAPLILKPPLQLRCLKHDAPYPFIGVCIAGSNCPANKRQCRITGPSGKSEHREQGKALRVGNVAATVKPVDFEVSKLVRTVCGDYPRQYHTFHLAGSRIAKVGDTRLRGRVPILLSGSDYPGNFADSR
jgi:hypothetical protein